MKKQKTINSIDLKTYKKLNIEPQGNRKNHNISLYSIQLKI